MYALLKVMPAYNRFHCATKDECGQKACGHIFVVASYIIL